MAEAFEKNIFQGYILQGSLKAALDYLRIFPDQAAFYDRYVTLFAGEPLGSESIDPELSAIFACYQNYYRDVFCREMDASEAEARLRGRFEALFGAQDTAPLDETEDRQITAAFREKGCFFLGGRFPGPVPGGKRPCRGGVPAGRGV